MSMIYMRVLSACLWGMEAGQLLGREDWVLCGKACEAAFAPKRAWKGQAAAACASTSTQLLPKVSIVKCETVALPRLI